MLLIKRGLVAAVAVTLMFSTLMLFTLMFVTGPVLAGADDYRFEPVGKPAKSEEGSIVQVRLVQKADGKAVAGAILIQPKLEMGEGPGAMTAPVKLTTAAGPGLYAFEVRPNMDGQWVLTFGAKVPGEAETVQGRIVLDLAQ